MDKENSIFQEFSYQRSPIYYQEDRPEYISLSPSTELTFEFEKNKFVAQLTISNLLIRSVSFKVKVSQAKYYLVCPADGELLPREQKILKIVMLPNYEHTERYKDRFLIQAFPLRKEAIGNNAKESMRSSESSQTEFNLAHNIKLGVRFMLSKSQNQMEWDQTPSRKTREPLMEKFPMQTPSTDDSLRYKNDVSQLNAMHYIPRRTKLTLSPDDQNEKVVSIEKSSSQYSQGGSSEQQSSKDASNHIKNNRNNHRLDSISSEELLDKSRPKLVRASGSFMDSVQLEAYLKQKLLQLENKYKKQKVQLTKMKEERDAFTQELNTKKFLFSGEFHTETACCTVEQKKCIGFQLWQLFMISVVFLILGSIIFSQSK